MKIETIEIFYDYSWRRHNPFSLSAFYYPKNVDTTTYISATDIHGKMWHLLDNGVRYDNKIYQKSHSRYDLVLDTFIMEENTHFRGHMTDSFYSNIIFRLCELEPDFNPENIDTIILSRDKRKRRSEHFIGFAREFVFIDFSKNPNALSEDQYVKMGVRCEMRVRDKMFHWLNKNNPMNNNDYDEYYHVQKQIIPLCKNMKTNDAVKELNNAIVYEMSILEGGASISILNVINRAQKEKNSKPIKDI